MPICWCGHDFEVHEVGGESSCCLDCELPLVLPPGRESAFHEPEED